MAGGRLPENQEHEQMVPVGKPCGRFTVGSQLEGQSSLLSQRDGKEIPASPVLGGRLRAGSGEW